VCPLEAQNMVVD